jgi:GntR family transcriptional repressor for pyruvate dehydrogenase complex
MLKQVKNTTLVDQVCTGLLAHIQAQKLQPGDSLPSIQVLERSFGVSRPVIREALTSLAAQGILEVANGKKATIRPITSDSLLTYFHFVLHIHQNAVNEFMEIRRGLEVQSAMLAAERHTEDELGQMKSHLDAIRNHLHEVDDFAKNDVELHLSIARASHNTMLFHLIYSIRETIKETIREGRLRRFSEEQVRKVQELHEALVAAIESGDPERAGKAMTMHFDEIAMSVGSDDSRVS